MTYYFVQGSVNIAHSSVDLRRINVKSVSYNGRALFCLSTMSSHMVRSPRPFLHTVSDQKLDGVKGPGMRLIVSNTMNRQG